MVLAIKSVGQHGGAGCKECRGNRMVLGVKSVGQHGGADCKECRAAGWSWV